MPVTILPPAELPADAVPEWLHLLTAGEVRTSDGRGPYRVSDATAMIAASLAGGKLALDENHATDLAGPRGEPAPARGWIVELQQRTDGIWGRVEWTGRGRRIMADREYRGVSPVIVHDKAGVISAILRASLTNTPNLVGLASLHSQGSPDIGAIARQLRVLRTAVDALADGKGGQTAPPLLTGTVSAPDRLTAVDQDMIRRLGIDPQAYAANAYPSDPDDGLNAADLEMIGKLGLDRTEYAKCKARE